MKMSIKDKAKRAAARVRCSKCVWWNGSHCVDPAVAKVCYESYVRGYINGYNQRRKEREK